MKYWLIILLPLMCLQESVSGIGFESNSNKIYVPVQVNDKGPFWFIIDTGSIANVVDAERSKSLGIQTSGSYDVRGAGEGSLPGSNANDVTLHAGDVSVVKETVEVLPINRAISYSEGHVVDGLLG